MYRSVESEEKFWEILVGRMLCSGLPARQLRFLWQWRYFEDIMTFFWGCLSSHKKTPFIVFKSGIPSFLLMLPPTYSNLCFFFVGWHNSALLSFHLTSHRPLSLNSQGLNSSTKVKWKLVDSGAVLELWGVAKFVKKKKRKTKKKTFLQRYYLITSWKSCSPLILLIPPWMKFPH